MMLIIGLLIGCCFGVFVMCLMSIASGDGSDDFEAETPCPACCAPWNAPCMSEYCFYESKGLLKPPKTASGRADGAGK